MYIATTDGFHGADSNQRPFSYWADCLTYFRSGRDIFTCSAHLECIKFPKTQEILKEIKQN